MILRYISIGDTGKPFPSLDLQALPLEVKGLKYTLNLPQVLSSYHVAFVNQRELHFPFVIHSQAPCLPQPRTLLLRVCGFWTYL